MRTLPPPSNIPPEIQEAWDRAGARLGLFARGLRCFSTVSSTNDLAMRFADLGADEGTVVLADAQTAGRGRRGREWFSPIGSGIYVSVVLRPSGESKQFPHWIASRLTVAAGVALAEGVRASTGLPVELKWPNDLVVGRRKLGGILTELSTTGADRPAVVVGIGVNSGLTVYTSTLVPVATSLEAELGRPIDRAPVLVETLAALAVRYEELRSTRFDAILTAWRAFAPSLRGAAIEWESPEGVVRGHAIDLDTDGALLAQAGDVVTRLVAGEVRWR
ncbi:MAG: biotin--[acetyl-CoA-carboxylase] ligase [Acidobacteria bacterium]|nr:MAG: biotin--[acetyl-CoA-carboxylase] ligase [Acidobacteriota bacterium]